MSLLRDMQKTIIDILSEFLLCSIATAMAMQMHSLISKMRERGATLDARGRSVNALIHRRRIEVQIEWVDRSADMDVVFDVDRN
jgi:hypothetical protein